MTLEDLQICGVHIKSKTQLGVLLGELHPHIDWTKLHLFKGRLSEQKYLERVVRSLFGEVRLDEWTNAIFAFIRSLCNPFMH
jgi:dsRNA-specific ribonuclease